MSVAPRYIHRGWVSLPIVVLLMVVAGLALSYNKQLLGNQRWQGQLQEVSQQKRVWQHFEEGVIRGVSFALAHHSRCLGFCALSSLTFSKHPFQWVDGSDSIVYRFDYYVNLQKVHYYRLCARHDAHHYRCWWWRKRQLVSHSLIIIQT